MAAAVAGLILALGLIAVGGATALTVERVGAVTPSASAARKAAIIAAQLEQRQRALSALVAEAEGLSPEDLAAATSLRQSPTGVTGGAAQRMARLRQEQDRLMALAASKSRERAERLGAGLRLAGVDPNRLSTAASAGRGGPLIRLEDPKALAAVLGVDEAFALRARGVAAALALSHSLRLAADQLPLARPTSGTVQSSGFGVRSDPFTGEGAFHSGLDFAGPRGTPVDATADGVVSFVGWRQGYGNSVEIDHGHGFKTRYGHLSAIDVGVGGKVSVGQRIGAIGSTGRSTGDHLHYEVWVDGRARNPLRFVRAGDYVQQAA